MKSAGELIAALQNKQISSVELVDASISRIEKLDKKINAVVTRDFERARVAAKAADAAIARGENRPLLGLPITVKESFNVLGLTTTWGNTQYKDWQPNADAVVISRLKEAGAIILGKTNIPFMLQDYQSYNNLFGTTNNPWDLNLTAGGSSGGSAAALAADFVSLELGSDLAGSLRAPAHYCGVASHKPSIDLVPLRGSGPPTLPPTSARIDFVVAGPMARTAADLEIGLDVLAGPDELTEGKAYKLSLPQSRHNKLSDFRVLIIDTHPLYPTAKAIHTAINNISDRLQKSGVNVTRDYKTLPDLAEITRTYATLLAAWASSFLLPEQYQRTIDAVNNLSANDRTLEACYLRGEVMTHRDWLFTTQTRERLRQQWRSLYNDFDVVLCPVMPTLAFPHDHSKNYEARQIEIDGKYFSYSHQYIWASIATLFGLPATVIPIELSDKGLPVGIQILGDYLEDKTTIAFAKMLEKEYSHKIELNYEG